MFRTFLLIFLCCGRTAVSVVFEYRGSAETYICPSPSLPRACLPDVKHNCEVGPRPRACEPMKRPQKLSLRR